MAIGRVGARHLLGVAALAALTSACGPRVDLRTGLQFESLATGWTDPAGDGGAHKLVPAVSFRLKNASAETLAPLQVNAIFRRVGDPGEWSNAMITAAGSAGLPPSASTGPLVIKGSLGYTGSDPQWDMLRNSHFVDARVELFARYGSQQWTRMGEYPIARQIVER
jgi:hypothetical protein